MTVNQAAKQAARESKDGATRFVVWVSDEGRAIYNASQLAKYRSFVFIEAAFLNGAQIAAESV